MSKIINYAISRHYKFRRKKSVFKYLDIIFAVIFFLILLNKLLL